MAKSGDYNRDHLIGFQVGSAVVLGYEKTKGGFDLVLSNSVKVSFQAIHTNERIRELLCGHSSLGTARV